MKLPAKVTIDKRELKRGGTYAMRMKEHTSHETMRAINRELDRIFTEEGIRFILVGPGMEILEIEEKVAL